MTRVLLTRFILEMTTHEKNSGPWHVNGARARWLAAICVIPLIQIPCTYLWGYALNSHGLHSHKISHTFNCPQAESRGEPLVIVYNRVPKTGSTFLLRTLKILAVRNNFTFVTPAAYYNHKAALDAILSALSTGTRSVIAEHFNFPEIIYSNKIAYINVVRDPVSRCVSYYHYIRDPAWLDREKNIDYLRQYGNMTIGQCLDEAIDHPCWNCVGSGQVSMFCGREGGKCDLPMDWKSRYETAWSNVLNYYDVVGTTEDIPGFASYIEELYPTFFKGILDALPRRLVNSVNYTRASDALIQKIKARTPPDEVQFYDRVNSRYKICAS
jgi:hypothetical protein